MMLEFNTAFYLVIGLSVLMYVVLDGFDLGVGILHLFARSDEQRRVFLNAIGPVWDGNEVWIVLVVGGLFAGFPNAYATILSGFYFLFMILVAGFVFRAVAIEFRSKRAGVVWRALWDVLFSGASALVAVVLGIVMGNLIMGIPLDEQQDYVGTFWDLFGWYSLSVGVLSLFLCAMHGAIYLFMKTEGEAHLVVRQWIKRAIYCFVGWFFVVSFETFFAAPHMFAPFRHQPALAVVPLSALAAMLGIPALIKREKAGWAFICSGVSIFMLLILYHLGTYPCLILSSDRVENSLTIYNAASSEKTLGILLLIVILGLPLVLFYGFWVYRTFRGKVKLDVSSY